MSRDVEQLGEKHKLATLRDCVELYKALPAERQAVFLSELPLLVKAAAEMEGFINMFSPPESAQVADTFTWVDDNDRKATFRLVEAKD